LSDERDGNGDAPAVQQLRVLGQAGDVLVAFALRPDDSLLATLVDGAHEREMSVIVMTGRDALTATPRPGAGGPVPIAETDIWTIVPHERTARFCELKLLPLHALWDAVALHLPGAAAL